MTFALQSGALRRARFSRERTLRNELRCWWVDEPKRWAAWLMLNPSDADEYRDDPTSRRVTHFSKAAGCDGWIIVNLYPFISSDPRAMWSWANWQNHGPAWDVRDDLQANLGHIEVAARAAHVRFVAFGAAPVYHDEVWLEQCLEAFEQPADDPAADDQLYCLGTNSLRQPLHPLARGKMYIPSDRAPVLWTREAGATVDAVDPQDGNTDAGPRA